ncbi:MAG: hypothetical protein HXL34_06865, partial [Prevotellaceae bacterium]|nr:hypothetical protein [Prevotellaceae bacterium]
MASVAFDIRYSASFSCPFFSATRPRFAFASDPSKLSVDELLYCATLETNANKRAEIYQKTCELYPADYRAFNNL